VKTVLRAFWLTGAFAATALGQTKASPCVASGTSVSTPALKKNVGTVTCDGSANAPTVTVAASATANVTGYTNPALLRLTTSATTLTLVPTIAAFDSSRTPWVSTTLTIQANRTWKVSVSTSATQWTATGTFAWQNKPIGDLQWRVSAPYTSTAWTSLTGTATQVAPQTGSGSAGGSNAVTLDWSARLSWTSDAPGSYSIPVTLTLTTP